eukprot:TRINITY_DN19555_c0_g1_i2.p1 TRINITY_DN19555_c0_g1~~TRINITY_DN19555_c0_g1_i2.p1  ORF type:complete len:294 (+),score=49.56 TRINITY_DN19555_c0_g1_i2:108-989(+)
MLRWKLPIQLAALRKDDVYGLCKPKGQPRGKRAREEREPFYCLRRQGSSKKQLPTLLLDSAVEERISTPLYESPRPRMRGHGSRATSSRSSSQPSQDVFSGLARTTDSGGGSTMPATPQMPGVPGPSGLLPMRRRPVTDAEVFAATLSSSGFGAAAAAAPTLAGSVLGPPKAASKPSGRARKAQHHAASAAAPPLQPIVAPMFADRLTRGLLEHAAPAAHAAARGPTSATASSSGATATSSALPHPKQFGRRFVMVPPDASGGGADAAGGFDGLVPQTQLPTPQWRCLTPAVP